MKKIMIILFLLPLLGFSQERYFSISSEVDVVNLMDVEEDINGYNGVFNLNFRAESSEFGITYETFPNLEFWSIGAGGGFVVNPTSNFNVLVGAKLSLIWRDVEGKERNHDPSAAFNIQPEYHFNNIFIFVRSEVRYRGDLKAMYGSSDNVITSGFFGIGYKFNFKRR